MNDLLCAMSFLQDKKSCLHSSGKWEEGAVKTKSNSDRQHSAEHSNGVNMTRKYLDGYFTFGGLFP